MSTHYTFCPKCGVRHDTTPAQAATNGIQCGVCGEKFFPERVERESDTGGMLSFIGVLLGLGGLAACVAGIVMGSTAIASAGAGVTSAGFSTVVAAQLFHVRQALEKLNTRK